MDFTTVFACFLVIDTVNPAAYTRFEYSWRTLLGLHLHRSTTSEEILWMSKEMVVDGF